MTLPFTSGPWQNPLNDEGWQSATCGTVSVQWRATTDAYEILAIVNHDPGNGHFRYVMELFEQWCKRDGKVLRVREVWNKELAGKLVKHEFTYGQGDDMVKRFKTK